MKNDKLGVGISLWCCNGSTIMGNSLYDNRYFDDEASNAIQIHESYFNVIKGNEIKDACRGIAAFFSVGNKIIANNITNNIDGITLFALGIPPIEEQNQIYHNSFISNSRNNACEKNMIGLNLWYNPTLKEGNYWDDITV